jgi:penicillin-insensitive murein endopeptidase
MSRAALSILVLLTISISGSAAAQDETSDAPGAGVERVARPTARGEPTPSVSVGFTNAGSIAHAVELEDTSSLFVKEGSADTRWGTAELVAMIERAADAVAEEFPGSRLTVGDLSRRRGGRAHPHASHRAGRDVDLGFYLKNTETDERVVVDRFINLNRGGRGRDQHGNRYDFDHARNWRMVATIIEDDRVDVQFILINGFIRRMLIRYARHAGVDEDLLQRFMDLSAGRSGSASHTSHFHVRIYCPMDDRPRCIDAPPFHSWVFTTEDEVQKRLTEWRENTPRRLRRRSRPRGRGMMRRRHAMRARMGMRRTAMRQRRSEMQTQVASRTP